MGSHVTRPTIHVSPMETGFMTRHLFGIGSHGRNTQVIISHPPGQTKNGQVNPGADQFCQNYAQQEGGSDAKTGQQYKNTAGITLSSCYYNKNAD